MHYLLEKYIKEKLNIVLKKVQILLKKSEKEIKLLLEKEDYSINYINFQNNSINGVIEKCNKKFFFKMLGNQDFDNEIIGYIKIKNALPVNRIIEIYKLQNCYIIIYEYENTISENEGLLNVFLVKNDIEVTDVSKQVINRIVNLYNSSFKVTINKNVYPMKQFFQERIKSRLKKWYSKEKFFDYNVNINGMESRKTTEIINEANNFFEKKCKLECSLSQGDPNTLNIGTKPIFFDFATSGYNPIICEFSATFWSVLIADAYFCPKYHPKSYYNHNKVFENIDKFNPDLRYEINDKEKKIKIQSNIKSSRIRINFMKEYIKMIETLEINIGKEIIYFLLMRILCIFDIRTMTKEDYFYSIFILHYLYENISEDVYTSLKNIIDNFDIIGG